MHGIKKEKIRKNLKPSSSGETVQVIVCEGSLGGGKMWNYAGKDLWNGLVLSWEWKKKGVMDKQSCESKEEEVMVEG